MRSLPKPALCLSLLALFLCLPAFGQDQRDIVPDTSCAPANPEDQPVVIEAREVEQLGTTIHASGGLFFRQATKRITASEATYDTAAKTGLLTNVSFTTCQGARPDYRITARELRLLPNSRVRARSVSLYLGGFKVITLPFLVTRTGRQSGAHRFFPRPSFDKDDGFSLAQEFRIIDSSRLHTTADLKLTTKRGLEGELRDEYGLDGVLSGFPGRLFNFDSLRNSALEMPRLPLGCTPTPEDLSTEGLARVRQFGRFSLKQRTYDIRNTGLVVYRQPELGIDYIAPHLNPAGSDLDPRLQLYPEVTATWGRFKEVPGSVGFTSRWGATAAIGANVARLGRYAAIQPVLLYGAYHYDTGESYQWWGYGVEASRLFPSGATVTGRYIKRSDSGDSPFLFDTVDVFQEAQAAFQVPFGKHVLGFVEGFDVDRGRTYDWQLLYGYRTDCLAAWVTWRSRLERLSFDIAVTNL